MRVGFELGLDDGLLVGTALGNALGVDDGIKEGSSDGDILGVAVGIEVGLDDGITMELMTVLKKEKCLVLHLALLYLV